MRLQGHVHPDEAGKQGDGERRGAIKLMGPSRHDDGSTYGWRFRRKIAGTNHRDTRTQGIGVGTFVSTLERPLHLVRAYLEDGDERWHIQDISGNRLLEIGAARFFHSA